MSTEYSVPLQAQALLRTGILDNPHLKDYMVDGIREAASHVNFRGNDFPSLPINWRFAESVSVLKAYEAAVLSVLLRRKYNVDPVQVNINTDHAQLFIMSCFMWTLDPDGEHIPANELMKADFRKKLARYFPSWEKGSQSQFRTAATNIYKTKDQRYFHVHGSMDADPTLRYLGLPPDLECESWQVAADRIEAAAAKHTAQELQDLADSNRQAGTICQTVSEFQASAHGRANARVNLFEIHDRPSASQAPCWWPSPGAAGPARPLAGLRVVDLTRVIAGPAITRGLAELGARVMRVVAPHLPDMSRLHPDLNHGKWNAVLDLREEGDREKLRRLVMDADVFVQGYRPGVLDKFGFGEEDVLGMVKGRERGIVYCAEDCYGWYGPWKGRSGWQQISDAHCGISDSFGKATGSDGPVTPVFPNSDYCTGIAGTIAIMTALLRRAEKGGSYTVQVALNYYNQWLIDHCGVYPPEVWEDLWNSNGSLVFKHTDAMGQLIPKILAQVSKNSSHKLLKPEFFTQYHVKNMGKDMRVVAPILQFPHDEVKPGFDVGTRTNGLDQARWPDDLDVEIVS